MPDTDPALILVTTTDALPREGEGLEVKGRTPATPTKGTAWQNAVIAERDKEIERLQAVARKRAKAIASQEKSLLEGAAIIMALREQLAAITAERNDYASAALAGLSAFGCTPMEGYVKDGGVSLMTADFKRAREAFKGLKAELTRVTADYDAVCSDIDNLRAMNENQRRSLEEDTTTITSLRSQLARAEVTVSTVAADLLGWPGEEFADLSDRLRSAFASPSPGPRGTPEGESRASMAKRYQSVLNEQGEQLVAAHSRIAVLETTLAGSLTAMRDAKARLAILERVAKHARDYDASELTADHFQHYHLLRLALADLDTFEAQLTKESA